MSTKNYFQIIFVVSTFLYIVTNVLSTSLGFTAVSNSFRENYFWKMLLPQGWGFFTRNPREDQYILHKYSVTASSLSQVSIKNTSYKNLLGLSRYSRRVNMELQRVLYHIPDSSYKESINWNNKTLVEKDIGLWYLDTGKYVVQKFRLPPWAWAKYPNSYSSPVHYAAIEVKQN